MLERLFYLSQSPEVSSRAFEPWLYDCSLASAAFARACREVLAPFTVNFERSRHVSGALPAILQAHWLDGDLQKARELYKDDAQTFHSLH